MSKLKTASFVLTLPLSCEEWQKARLDTLFRVCGQISNNLINDRRKALEQLERTKQWQAIQFEIAVLRDQKKKKLLNEKAVDALLAPWYDKRSELMSMFGFTEYAFQSKMKKWRRHHNRLVHSQVAQKLASSVWKKFEAYFFRDGERTDFIPWTEFFSIEGKSNVTGIVYQDGYVKLGKMKIPVKMPKGGNIYETEALAHRVKYCRIKRQWCEEGWRYFLQLVLEGEPPVKVRPTGEVMHPIGSGRVGLDIGTQTLAYSSSSTVGLVELAPAIKNINAELRRINRAMDRSRRAINPQMFNADGTIVPVNKLPPSCLSRCGKRKWVSSKHYKALAVRRRALYQKQVALRRQQHHELANQLLDQGDDFYIEQMRFRGLAKKSKEVKKSKTGKNLSRKRFGKSIANKAPATFVNVLEDKVIRAGGNFQNIKTWEAKASQYNHLDHSYNKKKLSQRWNQMPDGRRIQRDLYSAFLIQNSNSDLNGFDTQLCDTSYEHFVVLHDREIQRLKGMKMPSSAGV